jgi:hypothetical protein
VSGAGFGRGSVLLCVGLTEAAPALNPSINALPSDALADEPVTVSHCLSADNASVGGEAGVV